MAIEVDGKTYRNLPEQVEENANNIQWLLETIQSFGNVMRYCGSVATYDDLPTEDNRVGDVWNVLDTGNNYAWDGEGWDEISSIVDLSGYVTKIGSSLPVFYAETQGGSLTIKNFVIQHRSEIKENHPIIIIQIDEDRPGYYYNPWLVTFNEISDLDSQTLWTIQIRVYKLIDNAVYSTTANQYNDLTFDYINGKEAPLAKKYWGTFVGDETKFSSDMRVGDIIVETTGGQFLINNIRFTGGGLLSTVTLVGLEDNGNPVVHKFENGSWSSSNYINSNFVDLTSNQTITGEKTFIRSVNAKYSGSSTTTWAWNVSSDFACEIKRGTNNILTFVTTQGIGVDYHFYPVNINKDLGKPTNHWREGFIDKITDTNGSYSSDNVLNVINASDIVNNKFTASQFALINNGKPTLIKGTLLNQQNIFMFPLYEVSGNRRAVIISVDSDNNNRASVGSILITGNDELGYTINIGSSLLSLRSLERINGKIIPPYPASTGTFVLKCVDGGLTWVAE